MQNSMQPEDGFHVGFSNVIDRKYVLLNDAFTLICI